MLPRTEHQRRAQCLVSATEGIKSEVSGNTEQYSFRKPSDVESRTNFSLVTVEIAAGPCQPKPASAALVDPQKLPKDSSVRDGNSVSPHSPSSTNSNDENSSGETDALVVGIDDAEKGDTDRPADVEAPTKHTPDGCGGGKAVEDGGITSMGMKVLCLLALQNCSKNLLMRYVMKEKPNFLTSAAVIGVELTKLVLSTLYILLVDRRPVGDILAFMKEDWWNALLLAVPAASYSLQMSLEYVALANIDASVFSVLVQTKLLATASFAVIIMKKQIRKVQLISLVLLTVGVMLCNMKNYLASEEGMDDETKTDTIRGVTATLGIALSSGFASVYTEKVIKAQRSVTVARENYSLAFMQVQLAVVSLIILGFVAVIKDLDAIVENGLWHNFNTGAFVSVFVSAIGGLLVAAVLKFADAVLKGYATAISVVFTGLLSMVLFGTHLNVTYGLGIVVVVCAVLLYNANDLDRKMC